jgi:hypothetical protein
MLMLFDDAPLVGGAIAVAGLGPLFWTIDRKLNPSLLVGPASYAFLFHLLGYAVGPLGQHYFSVEPQRFSTRGMVQAQWGALLGLLTLVALYPPAFRLGERLAKRAPGSELRPGDTRWTSYTTLLALTALGILVFAHLNNAFRRLGDFEAPGTEVQSAAAAFASVQQVVFFFLALIAAWHRRRGPLLFWLFATLTYGIYTLLEGTRGLSITSLFISALGFAIGGVSRKRVAIGLGLAATGFLPLVGVVDHYRSTATYSSRYDEGWRGRTDAFLSAASDFELESKANRTSASDVFYNSVTAATVDRIMEDTPGRVPFAAFRDLEAIAYVWLPKVIEPDRPTFSDGNSIAAEYGVGHDGFKSWVFTPTVGEGYRRFGWLGIPLVYGLVALVFGMTTGACWARRRQREWAALVVFCFLQAPLMWSSTLLYLAYYALWVFPKFFIFFYGLRKLQDLVEGFRHSRTAIVTLDSKGVYGPRTKYS